MAKKGKNKSRNLGDLRDLATLVEDQKPLPSSMEIEPGALEAMMAAFQSSDVAKGLAEAAEDRRLAEEIRTQVRALAREQKDVKVTQETLARDLRNAERDGGRIQTSKMVLRASAKSQFLNGKDIALVRAKLEKNFNEFMGKVIQAGLDASERYQGLVAESILVTKNAEKLSRNLGKADRKIAALEKKMNRLSADAQQLDAAAVELEGGIHA